MYTQICAFLQKASFMCLQIMTSKGCVGGRTKSLGSVRLEETSGGPELGSCSKAWRDGMVGSAGKAGTLVRHELPMVNGEFGLPEMSLLRCPSE